MTEYGTFYLDNVLFYWTQIDHLNNLRMQILDDQYNELLIIPYYGVDTETVLRQTNYFKASDIKNKFEEYLK